MESSTPKGTNVIPRMNLISEEERDLAARYWQRSHPSGKREEMEHNIEAASNEKNIGIFLSGNLQADEEYMAAYRVLARDAGCFIGPFTRINERTAKAAVKGRFLKSSLSGTAEL